MATLTCAGFSVSRGRLTVPRKGAWHADLWLDADTDPTGAVSLVWEGASSPWQGTVVRGGVVTEGGPAQVRVVGGAGGLSKVLAGGSYRLTSARVVLGQILAAAGERLSGTSPAALLDPLLPRWSRQAGAAGIQLDALAEQLGTGWRVLADGSIYLGPAPSGALTLPTDGQVVRRQPAAGLVTVATASPFELSPGLTFEGAVVACLVHTLSPDALRTELWAA